MVEIRCLTLLLSVAACSTAPAPSADEPSDASITAAPPDAEPAALPAPDATMPDSGSAGPDSGDLPSDAGGPLDAGTPPDASLPDVGATTLPLTLTQAVRVGEPGAMDLTSAVVEGAGGPRVVFERFDTAFASAQLLEVRPGPDQWSKSRPLALLEAPIVASPSEVAVGGSSWLYFLRADSLSGALRLFRSRVDGEGFATPEELPAVAGLSRVLSWPRYFDLPDGRVGVAFRDGASKPRLALSADGRTFGDALTVGPAAAMAAACAFADGSLVFTYQTGTSGMTSWFRLSRDDGRTWSTATRVTTRSSNVHDTTAVRRLDGGVDLYFIYPAGGAGFSTFRRALLPDGRLGPEEQVTALEVGDTSKPGVTRLADGRLLLRWAEISARAANGEPSEQRLWVALLAGDAPGP